MAANAAVWLGSLIGHHRSAKDAVLSAKAGQAAQVATIVVVRATTVSRETCDSLRRDEWKGAGLSAVSPKPAPPVPIPTDENPRPQNHITKTPTQSQMSEARTGAPKWQ